MSDKLPDVIISREVADFLLGVGPLEGRWFGDTGPIENGYRKQFWWRKYINGNLDQQRKCAIGNQTHKRDKP